MGEVSLRSSGSATVTSVASSASSVSIVAANPRRRGMIKVLDKGL